MNDSPSEWRRGQYAISTARARLDLPTVFALLRATHWGSGLTQAQLERAVAHSVCFGLYHGVTLVGFGRVITDLATYGYLTDVVIAPDHQHRGLGTWLTACMIDHPQLQGFRRLALVTRDAETLYARAGFVAGAGPLVYMERRDTGPTG
jgi:N-acetylglutamate synthase-like GNAT family acetyltransferase